MQWRRVDGRPNSARRVGRSPAHALLSLARAVTSVDPPAQPCASARANASRVPTCTDPRAPSLSASTSDGGWALQTNGGYSGANFAKGKPTSELRDFYALDDYFTDTDSNAYSLPTFLGNHDQGRFAFYVREGNKGASPEELLERVKLGHVLMFTWRGVPNRSSSTSASPFACFAEVAGALPGLSGVRAASAEELARLLETHPDIANFQNFYNELLARDPGQPAAEDRRQRAGEPRSDDGDAHGEGAPQARAAASAA